MVMKHVKQYASVVGTACLLSFSACDDDGATLGTDDVTTEANPWAPKRIADIEPVEFSAFEDVGPETVHEFRVEEPGARFLKIRFDEIDLAPGDWLEIVNGAGETVQRLGEHSRGLWSRSVVGDHLTIRITTGDTSSRGGIHIDAIAIGSEDLFADTPSEGGTPFRSICGSDDKVPAACFDGDAAVRSAANPVARLLFPTGGGFSVCTGAIISEDNHFITNNHCVASQNAVSQTEFLFNFEAANCNGSGSKQAQSTTGGTFLATSGPLDYTLLQLNADAEAVFGHLELAPVSVSTNTEIYIPQHPGGREKEIAFNEGLGGDACRVRRTNVSIQGFQSGANLGYSCDTEGGSSGSPVIRASDNAMIALHHLGGCNNHGTYMRDIMPEIEGFLSPSDDGGDPAANSCETRCGGQAPAGCFCDSLCVQFGDCCPDVEAACG